MNIKQLCKLSHNMAVKKGFWTIAKDGVGCPRGLLPRNISELLMLIVTELGEACEALRKGNIQVHYNNKLRDKDWLKDTFEDEIADVFIRLGDLCEALEIDIEWQIKKKMEYNKTRPQKHGKKF